MSKTKFSKNKNSILINGNNTNKIKNEIIKNRGISAYDNDTEIDIQQIKEFMIFRHDAVTTDAGYKNNPFLAAEEMLEFADIVYDKILEAEFIRKDEFVVFLRVKLLTTGTKYKKIGQDKFLKSKFKDK